MLPTIVAKGTYTWVGDGTLGTAAQLWEIVAGVVVEPLLEQHPLSFQLLLLFDIATVAAVALITSTSA